MEKGAIRSFRDLDAWRVAADLVLECYALARQLPGSERLELSSQLRKAAVSIPSNIAEGQSTGSTRRFAYHVRVARGSAGEVETLLELIRRLGFSGSDTGTCEEKLARCVSSYTVLPVVCEGSGSRTCPGLTLLFLLNTGGSNRSVAITAW